MKLTERTIREIYAELLHSAQKAEVKGNVNLANKFLYCLSYVAYTFFLTYKDKKADEICHKISERINKRPNYELPSNERRLVFLDNLCCFRAGLTYQYLQAIKKAGWKYLYIADFQLKGDDRVALKKFILQNPNSEIIEICPELKGMDRLQYLYDTILDYKPTDVIIHVSPYSPYFVEVCRILPTEICRYQINYTDHSFILGYESFDFELNFRNYGCSVSRLCRDVKAEQQFLHPFYPNIERSGFNGFPPETYGKKIIFSGGSQWKIIDSDDTYFKMCKSILDANPDAVIVYAGKVDKSFIESKIQKYNLDGRFLLLGWRSDVIEMFEHCDIYLSTYPAIGGLMGVYAALCAKPILALKSSSVGNTESTVCQINSYPITKRTINEVVEEATHLLTDEEYKFRVGNILQNCVVTPDWFCDTFIDIVENKKNTNIPINIDNNVSISQSSIDGAIKNQQATGDWCSAVFWELRWRTLLLDYRIFLHFLFSVVFKRSFFVKIKKHFGFKCD